MNFNALIKPLIWIAFFLLALAGVYLFLRRLGLI